MGVFNIIFKRKLQSTKTLTIICLNNEWFIIAKNYRVLKYRSGFLIVCYSFIIVKNYRILKPDGTSIALPDCFYHSEKLQSTKTS